MGLSLAHPVEIDPRLRIGDAPCEPPQHSGFKRSKGLARRGALFGVGREAGLAEICGISAGETGAGASRPAIGFTCRVTCAQSSCSCRANLRLTVFRSFGSIGKA